MIRYFELAWISRPLLKDTPGKVKVILTLTIVIAFFTAVDYLAPHSVDALSKPGIQKSKITQSTNIESDTSLKEKADDRIADYTLWLAVFTCALAVVSSIQIGFLIRADQTARISANASTLAANAAVTIELPIVRIYPPALIGLHKVPDETDTKFSGFFVTSQLHKICGITMFKIKNDGRTPAFPIEINVGHHIGNKLPETPLYLNKITSSPHELIKPDTELSSDIGIYLINISDYEIKSVFDLERMFWVYCSVRYSDFMDNPHEVRFCWLWSQPGGSGQWHFVKSRDAPTAYLSKH